jgi:hypothetical protein
MKPEALTYEFVEFIPDSLREGTIYISVKFATVVHKCCCGCGNEVVTPLSPTDWKLIFDGVSVSLDPSIGNWSFDCRSHYWIRGNRVRWATRWSQQEVDAERSRDRSVKAGYFDIPDSATKDAGPRLSGGKAELGFWRRLKQRWMHPKK